jgi:DNA replication and repair protein RecF
MILALTIQDLRVIRELEMAPAPGINVISGDNGAGKTSVLEAVYLAGRGRSFRHNEAKPLIREGADEVRVIAKISDSFDGPPMTLGLSRDRRLFDVALTDRTSRSGLYWLRHCRFNGSVLNLNSFSN